MSRSPLLKAPRRLRADPGRSIHTETIAPGTMRDEASASVTSASLTKTLPRSRAATTRLREPSRPGLARNLSSLMPASSSPTVHRSTVLPCPSRWVARPAPPALPALLPPGLQLVISEELARLGERLAVVDGRADLLLDGVDLFGGGKHRLFVRARDDEHPVRVAAQQIAWGDARVANRHRAIHRLDLHAVLAGAHGVAAAVDRIAKLAREVRVAAGAVDDRSGHAATIRDPGQDVAPHGGVRAPAVIEHHHVARLDIVDVIADGAGRIPRGAVEDRERAARHAE